MVLVPSLPIGELKRNTKRIGHVSETAAMHFFAKAGYIVSVPFGDNAPYDLIVDDTRGHLSRVQVKSGRLRAGVVRFNTYSSHAHRNGSDQRYVGKIDAFVVYCPDLGDLFWIPVDDAVVRTARGWLRIAPPRNNMRSRIHWAEPYRLNGDGPAIGAGPSKSGALDED